MTTLAVPRYGIPLIGPDGLMSRDWYRYFAALPQALNNSPTSFDDAITQSSMDDIAIEAGLAHVTRVADAALAQAFYAVPPDQPVPPDLSLLAWFL